ncbi:hypothetical protein ACHAXR_011865 [Thalassiosira sp. AJA248-18]
MKSSSTLRYVPQGTASFSSDAPGWSAEQKNDEQKGPTCWKCKGMCFRPILKKPKHSVQKSADSSTHHLDDSASNTNNTTTHQRQNQRTCPVCNGKGHLPIRSKYLQSRTEPGVVTSRRRRPRGWKEFGHIPPVVQAMLASSDLKDEKIDDNENGNSAAMVMHHAISLLHQASGRDDDYDTKPYVAASTFLNAINSKDEEEKKTIRYLDLGTGNASVLQMATWYLLSNLKNKQCKLEAVGVEARSEAVGLARRSLSFNLGTVEHGGKVYTGGFDSATDAAPMDHDVQIVQGDFRDLVSLSLTTNHRENTSAIEKGKELENVASKRYDLITGTPPYFRVGFKSSKASNAGNKSSAEMDSNDEVITSAVIEQGGMPTSMQSAPARCEFRGGIEAYCLTASAMLSQPHGLFVVCENWLNNDRVWKGAKEAGLNIECVWPVMGGVRKENNLFAVYVMKKCCTDAHAGGGGDGPKEGTVRPSLVVRDEDGKWTKDNGQKTMRTSWKPCRFQWFGEALRKDIVDRSLRIDSE